MVRSLITLALFPMLASVAWPVGHVPEGVASFHGRQTPPRQQRRVPRETEATAKKRKPARAAERKQEKPTSRPKPTARSVEPRTEKPSRPDSVSPPKFRWPVKGRRILEPYGERVNPSTGTTTVNPGINIAAQRGAKVSAAAGGTVSLVSWLPGYLTLVIVEHSGGYRSVYANLDAATVAKGRKLKPGDQLGRSGRSRGGDFLHFEIWRGQTRLDPTTLLPR